MMNQELNVRTKLQTIYYMDKKEQLGVAYATADKRITLEEAKEILDRRNTDYSEILKVKYETVDLEIPVEEFDTFKK